MEIFFQSMKKVGQLARETTNQVDIALVRNGQHFDIYFLQVTIDVTVGRAVSPIDTRSPFKQLGGLEQCKFLASRKQHQSGHNMGIGPGTF